MRKMIFLFSLILGGVFFNGNTLNAQAEDKDYTMVVVEEVYFFDELDYAFYQSFNAFQNGEDAKSGARLKRAAYYVKMEAEDAKVHNKKPILKQARRLESLADSIALGKVQSSYRLRRAFTRTHHIIAKDYKLRAAAFWSEDKVEDTGRALVSAGGYLGHAAKWSGQKIEQGVVGTGKAVGKAGKATGKAAKKTGKAVGKGAKTLGVESYRGVRWLGGKMIKGVAFVPKKVGQSLEWLGNGIDKVGEEVEPKPKKN